MGSSIYIDFKKLNVVTKKYPFLYFPFIDEVLNTMARCEAY